MAGTDGHNSSFRLPDAVKSELNDLDKPGRGWLIAAMKEYSKGQLPASKVKPIGDGILEIVVNRAGTWYRCLLFHPKAYIAVALLVYQKKSNKLPKRHLDTAKARRRAWEHGRSSL